MDKLELFSKCLNLVEGRENPESWWGWWNEHESEVEKLLNHGEFLKLKPRSHGFSWVPVFGSQKGAITILEKNGIAFEISNLYQERYLEELDAYCKEQKRVQREKQKKFKAQHPEWFTQYPKFSKMLAKVLDSSDEIKSAATVEKIVEIEKKLGFILPTQVREFFLITEGVNVSTGLSISLSQLFNLTIHEEHYCVSIQERLKDLRVERGLTLEQLAEETHLSKSALGSYEGDNLKDISHHALIQLAKVYEVTVDYLLGRSKTKNHPNADLADLRLSDDMIELLKSGRVDTSLLCELAVHPDFPRLMADLEIYVNGTAVKQVQSANAIVDIMSATIMKQHNPGLSDPQLRQLVAAHIDDDSFCRYVIQQDINKIALDLREAHKDDFFSVPEDNPLEDFLQTAEETASPDSDPEQAALAFICKRLKLNLKKLSEEEKKWLKKIAQKSDLLKNPNPQRGRK